MTRRPKPKPPPPPTGLLDWTDSTHWDHRDPRPCRYCGHPTHLRDSSRSPADKVCAEQALAQQAEEATSAYGKDTL